MFHIFSLSYAFIIFRISSCSKIIFKSCPDSNSQNHMTHIYFLCRLLYRYPLPYPMQIILFQILINSEITLIWNSWTSVWQNTRVFAPCYPQNSYLQIFKGNQTLLWFYKYMQKMSKRRKHEPIRENQTKTRVREDLSLLPETLTKMPFNNTISIHVD